MGGLGFFDELGGLFTEFGRDFLNLVNPFAEEEKSDRGIDLPGALPTQATGPVRPQADLGALGNINRGLGTGINVSQTDPIPESPAQAQRLAIPRDQRFAFDRASERSADFRGPLEEPSTLRKVGDFLGFTEKRTRSDQLNDLKIMALVENEMKSALTNAFASGDPAKFIAGKLPEWEKKFGEEGSFFLKQMLSNPALMSGIESLTEPLTGDNPNPEALRAFATQGRQGLFKWHLQQKVDPERIAQMTLGLTDLFKTIDQTEGFEEADLKKMTPFEFVQKWNEQALEGQEITADQMQILTGNSEFRSRFSVEDIQKLASAKRSDRQTTDEIRENAKARAEATSAAEAKNAPAKLAREVEKARALAEVRQEGKSVEVLDAEGSPTFVSESRFNAARDVGTPFEKVNRFGTSMQFTTPDGDIVNVDTPGEIDQLPPGSIRTSRGDNEIVDAFSANEPLSRTPQRTTRAIAAGNPNLIIGEPTSAFTWTNPETGERFVQNFKHQAAALSEAGFEPPKGLRVQNGRLTSDSTLTKPVAAKVQDRAVEVSFQLEELRRIQDGFESRPEFLQAPTRLRLLWNTAKDKGLGTLAPDEKKELQEYTGWLSANNSFVNAYIKAITGAQMSRFEADRIIAAIGFSGTNTLKSLLSLDFNSPSEFTGKVDNVMYALKLSGARANYVFNKGIQFRPDQDPANMAGEEQKDIQTPSYGIPLRRLEDLILEERASARQAVTRLEGEEDEAFKIRQQEAADAQTLGVFGISIEDLYGGELADELRFL